MAGRDTSISTYRGKRDFGRTPEPAPAAGKRARKQAIFVVQKHAASRLHWDFRLEHGGVLWSWAVPKGPSLDTGHKRLAMRTEDHPLEYAGFEGVIPAGNYGAGVVEIWDRGTWLPVGDAAADLARGEIKFELDGARLHGRFVLIRLKPRPGERGESWLLIKEHDGLEQAGVDAAELEGTPLPASAPAKPRRKPARAEAAKPKKTAEKAKAPKTIAGAAWQAPEGARKAALPSGQAPMLASTADAPPQGGEWLSEIKFDGYRLIVRKDGATVTLLTRNGLDWTHRLRAVADAVGKLPADTLLADGELVALEPGGLSSFPDLQAALKEGRTFRLHLYLFDLLYRDGYDLRDLPLTARKAALVSLVPEQDFIRVSDHLEGVTDHVRRSACAMGLEGIICKRADGAYHAGRSRDWLKVKCQGREEFVVLGWTEPAGSRTGLGSLQLGFYAPDKALHYVGGCGSGFTDATLRDLSARLDGLASAAPKQLLLTEEKPPKGLHWVLPELVAEVQYTGWSGAGRLRHPVFLGLREDKAAADVVREVPNPDAVRRELAGAVASHSGRIVRAAKPSARASEMGGVRLTHPERELWPAEGGHKAVTKQDLAAYWQAVAAVALPGIAERPLAFVRCPDGIDGEHFFQKHANRGMPDALHEGAFDEAPYLALDDVAGLIATAQMSAVELHSWGSALPDAGKPDRLVFDLDPGEGVAWAAITAAAHDIKARLEQEGFASWCRTSGGKGLHVVVPLRDAPDWDATRAWCRGFAEALEREKPALYVASVPKARRRGKILIDWLRNGLGSTAIASFSPRARPHATVAVPVSWREVGAKLDPQAFTVHSVPARLAKLRTDPWDGFGSAKQSLSIKPARKRAHG
jgi:bifunctional non-homologous end joining protein LigD